MQNQYHDIPGLVSQFRHGQITFDAAVDAGRRRELRPDPQPEPHLHYRSACTTRMIPILQQFSPGLILPPMPVPAQCQAAGASQADRLAISPRR